MKKLPLGRSSLMVTPFCFGGNVFGWTVRSQQEASRLLDHLVAAGGNFIDTADSYSKWAPGNQGGESETLIGHWLKNRKDRSDLVIATKVGADLGHGNKGLSRKHILASVEGSLNRLQTGYIDLYQAHFDDPQTPLEETLGAFGELIASGKIRTIGASNFSPARLREAIGLSEGKKYPRYESLQPRYNMYDREEFETQLEPLCREKGLGVITYYSLASGFLTGKYRSEKDQDKSQRGKGISAYLNERGSRILDALDEVAGRMGTRPASVALAWLVSKSTVTSAIASATSPQQLDDLVSGVSLHLDEEALGRLDKASSPS